MARVRVRAKEDQDVISRLRVEVEKLRAEVERHKQHAANMQAIVAAERHTNPDRAECECEGCERARSGVRVEVKKLRAEAKERERYIRLQVDQAEKLRAEREMALAERDACRLANEDLWQRQRKSWKRAERAEGLARELAEALRGRWMPDAPPAAEVLRRYDEAQKERP